MKSIQECLQRIAPALSQILQRGTNEYSITHNPTGDKQLQLDLEMNTYLITHLERLPEVYGIISEELEEMQICNEEGSYILAMDPLDGSNVAPIGLSVGTSIGIYSREKEVPDGSTLLESAYILYGSRLTFTYTSEATVWTTTHIGDAWTTPRALPPLPANASHVAPGAWMDYKRDHQLWPRFETLIDRERPKPRYMGSLTADTHLILRQSGVFLYPTPKLRLLYEILPLGHMVTLLGGAAQAWDGTPVEELKVNDIHQTAGCILGCKDTVTQLLP